MIQMKNFKWEQDGDGFVSIIWDMPGKSMNVISDEALEEMRLWVEAITNDASVKGVVLTSGKATFSGGADLNEMEAALRGAEGAKDPLVAVGPAIERVKKLHAVLRALETCKKPVIAAITGTCLGGAFEMALACHARICADAPRAQIGLPEARIGLLPGGGGTQRLPRLIGARAALPLMLQGQRQGPQQWKDTGVFMAVVPADQLMATAKKWLKESPRSVQPWDEKGFRIPDGGPYTPKGFETFTAGNALLRRETYGNYPAQINIMKCVYEGLQVPIDAGLRIELRYFIDLLRRPESRAMIRTLFLSIQALEKGARRPQSIAQTQVKKLGVLGAGTMGAGIANVSAQAGMDVVLIDRDQASADKGKAHAASTIDRDISRGRSTAEKKADVLSHITPTPDYGALKGCDFVIEAVFEDRNVKADATKKADAQLSDGAFFGSNTSTLPITSLAESSSRPDHFIGIHFFSPVERMGLVEIIRGKKTSDEALAHAMDYVRQIKKTPIVVNDSRGFYTSRCFSMYTNEGALMIAESLYPALIENVGRMSGMPMGPLEVIDSVGIGTPLHIIRQARQDLGTNVDDEAEKLYSFVAEANNRGGRGLGKGFYDYDAPGGRRQRIWPELYNYQHKKWVKDADVEEMKRRFLFVQAREAALCMEEGVITDPRDGDVGAILGWGFAPFTGGPLSMIDSMGADNFVAGLKALQKKYGERFKPTKLLNAMAKNGDTFYGRFLKAAA